MSYINYKAALASYQSSNAQKSGIQKTSKASQRKNQWNRLKSLFKSYIRLECNLSANSTIAYMKDVERLENYTNTQYPKLTPQDVTREVLQEFMVQVCSKLSVNSHIRIMTGLRSFFHFLHVEKEIKYNPAALLDLPRKVTKLPTVLSGYEITRILKFIDLDSGEGIRNSAIIEVLYGSGIRASELVNLKISELSQEKGYMSVTGKGDKQRLVPMNFSSETAIRQYQKKVRCKLKIQKGHEDYVFLSSSGKKITAKHLTRIIINSVKSAGVRKVVTPHTFRHTFATHLVEGGANLIAVMQFLGHEQITTTEIYTLLNVSHLREQVNTFHPRSNRLKL